jgi:soluble lytic murein transglycosylase
MRQVAALLLLSGALLIGHPTDAGAELYMYRDSRGALHFSNAPSSPGYQPYRPPALGRGGVARYRPDPKRRRAFDPLIRDAARRYRVDHALVKAVIRAESDFVPYARSPKGALGLMQLMPATARLYNVWRIFEPRENIEAGVKHLRLLLDRFNGNVRLALAAYNAGAEAVARHRGVPPYRETVEYLDRVLRFQAQYAREF